MNLRKMIIAVFAGGSIGALVGIWLAASFWWLGILVGFAAGYLGYEFRQTLAAIPVAFRAARAGASATTQRALNWFAKPHPFAYPSFLVAVTALCVLDRRTGVTAAIWQEFVSGGFALAGIVVIPILLLAFLFLGSVFCSYVLIVFAFIGADSVRECWRWDDSDSYWGLRSISEVTSRLGSSYSEQPLIYRNVARWVLHGVGAVLTFFVWRLWVQAAHALWGFLCFLGNLLFRFVTLIRSNERMACGLYAAMGSGASLWLYVLPSADLTLGQQVACVVSGGVLATALGLVGQKLLGILLPYLSSSHEA